MKPTLKLLADWCTLLMNGYQSTAADYRRDPSAMNQQCLDANVICLHNLADAVQVLLPEVWPELRLVAPGAFWHVDPHFDWDAAERELRLIQAAAMQAERAEAELKINEVVCDATRSGNKRSWTQPDLDRAIEEYKAARSSNFHELVERVQRGDDGAKKAARKMFGRNVIVNHFKVRSPAMVTNSTAWQGIADALDLRNKPKPVKVGLESAIADKAEEVVVPEVDKAIRRETIRLVKNGLPKDQAEATIEKLDRDDMTDDEAREMVKTLNQS